MVEFYEEFAKELHKTTGFDVLGLSHTGHLFDDSVTHWDPADVVTQINDKVKFIENYFMRTDNDQDNNGEPGDIYFIGHSFGCYVILEILTLLSKDVKNRVKQAYMLFPMVERIAETPNGRALNFATKYFLQLVYLFAYMITFLPRFLQRFVVNRVFEKRHAMDDLHENLGNLLNALFNLWLKCVLCNHISFYK